MNSCSKEVLLVSARGVVTLLCVLVLGSCANTSTPARTTLADDQYVELARVVFEESNILRSNPATYVEILGEYQKRYSGNTYYRENNPVGIVTNEGVNAVKESINVLEAQSSLKSLRWSEALAKLARAHVMDTGVKGLVGHDGSGANTFQKRIETVLQFGVMSAAGENIAYGHSVGREVVLQLVIDDGVPGRGHRENMLKEGFNVSGVGCGYHRKYTTMCVVIYGTIQE